MKQLAIIGASGHGKVVADIARKNGYDQIIFFDDKEAIKECGGYPVVGKSNDVLNYKCDTVVAIGNAEIRRRIQESLEISGVEIPVLVHPNAVIGENVILNAGTVVAAGAVINPGSKVGKGCIINTCSSVDHDCQLGDYVHVSIGAHLAGTVKVESGTWIGAGSIINNNLNIVSNCMIGAGAVVINDIDERGTYVGVPAKRIK